MAQARSLHSHRLRGFTLFELLFVLAIVGALSAVAILFYQQRVQNQKVEKTVMQMEQWMQAGISFYVEHGEWPVSTRQLLGSFMPQYAANENPWCRDPEGTEPGTCYTVEAEPNNKKLFSVTANIGSASDAVRKAIAARLPYVKLSTVQGHITALINLPLLQTRNEDVILTDIATYPIRPVSADFTEVGSGSQTYFVSRDIRVLTTPSCTQYGDNYELAVYPTITGYSTSNTSSNDSQPPGISRFSVEAIRQADNSYRYRIMVRPQRYYFEGTASCLWDRRGGLREFVCTESRGAEPAFKSELNLTLTVLFACKKKGVISEYDIQQQNGARSFFEETQPNTRNSEASPIEPEQQAVPKNNQKNSDGSETPATSNKFRF